MVWGGTNNEYASYQSLDSPSTQNTSVIGKVNSDSFNASVTVKWVLQYPATAVGYGSGNIDAQLKLGSTGQFITIRWGTSNGNNAGHPPVVLKATALPSTANLHINTSSSGSGGQ